MSQAPRPTKQVISSVRALRRARRWSAQELADRLTAAGCYMGRSRIAALETGFRERVSVDELFAFAFVLGVSVERLTNGPACEACNEAPPTGYTCNRCGRESR